MSENKARLILKDSTVFEGKAQGFAKSVAGEVVFTTGMVGYEQSLTDPSYAGQILVFTYPLIGNWGVPPKIFWESSKIHVLGVVISDLTEKPNHHLMQSTLDRWLKNQKIPAICGIDTRRLTQKLREKGVMLGKIVIGNNDIDFWNPNETDLVSKVSPKRMKIWRPGTRDQEPETRKNKTGNLTIGLLNCGAKESIKNNLLKRGARVYDLPWNFDPFENNLPIDGLVISNGPGDPKMPKKSIEIIRKSLNKKIPTLGICLGNELLALAAGGNTYKLKFGHRAQNQPTIQEKTKKCFITTQNHGFAVDDNKLPKYFKRWFYNANDNSNEGIIHENLPFFSVQFHPEAAPGPTDTEWLFDFFLKKVKEV